MSNPTSKDIEIFNKLIDEYRYDFERLSYIIFPFGQAGTALENMRPYEWQIEEWRKLSKHLMNPLTRFDAYRLIISSGNGAAKTAFGAMTIIMLMYTQRLRARLTANTDTQMRSVVWPEYDKWLRLARFNDVFFDKFGTSIKAKKESLADTWRVDTVTWHENSPASISGLHNKGNAIAYVFEEAPGIPAVIWDYASGAFTETETIKLFFAFGNSDDPESKFEQNMTSPLWHARRIDTRELDYVDKSQIKAWLEECGGNEDHDEFRIRVRGLPRKTSKDSIISVEAIEMALKRRDGFDIKSVSMLPCVIMVDPAWTGGDETVISMRQGHYIKLLERYKLDKTQGEDHMTTYLRVCKWERQFGADAVWIDQGEGTGIYTIAMNNSKYHWELVSFAGSPTDHPDSKMSEYANVRAQMYYETNKFLMKGGILDSEQEEWISDIKKQLTWTKGGRHKTTGKKLAEAKTDIKSRVGMSPDIADSLVMGQFRQLLDRLPENDKYNNDHSVGGGAYKMPEHDDPYETIDAQYRHLYN